MKLLPDEQLVMERIEKAYKSVCTVLASRGKVMTHDFPEPWWQAPRPPAEAGNTQEHIRSTQATKGRSTTGARGSRGNTKEGGAH